MRNAPPPRGRATAALPANTERSIVLHGSQTKATNGDLSQKVSYLPDIHRLLPQSPDAEQGLLSSFLLSPNEVGGLCIEKEITTNHFHIPSNAEIYRTLFDLNEKRKPIDFITLTGVLRDSGKLDQCGGAAFITQLFCFLPTAANASHYADILEQKFVLREIIKVCTEYAARSYDEQDDVPNLLNDVEQKILAIHRSDSAELRDEDPKKLLMQAVCDIEAAYEARGAITGIPTGFAELDETLDGLQRGDMIVIAARPSMGKTSIAIGIAEHIAITTNQTIAFFSAEMSPKQIMQRLLLSRSRVNLRRVRNGFLYERDFPAIQKAASEIGNGKFRIIDAIGSTINGIRARTRRLKRSHPDLAAVFIDYLQLIRSHSRQAQNSREREIAEVSAGCKEMAKELGIAVVVLAQLNRDAEKRAGTKGRPRLSDLRESGSIEQDADVVGLLHREEYYAENEEEKRETEGRATLIIAKQRNGPVGDIPLTFLKEMARYESRARET